MFRVISAVIFVICGLLIGNSKSDKLKRKIILFRETEFLIERVEYQIRYNMATVYEICRYLKNNNFDILSDFINSLPSEFNFGISFYNQWENAINSYSEITGTEKEILLEIGSVLGNSDAEGQVQALNRIKNDLKYEYNNAKEEYKNKGRLYRNVGILSGMIAGIIII